jgi:hypothetical protein
MRPPFVSDTVEFWTVPSGGGGTVSYNVMSTFRPVPPGMREADSRRSSCNAVAGEQRRAQSRDRPAGASYAPGGRATRRRAVLPLLRRSLATES